MVGNDADFVVPETFTIRPGTIEYGKEYETKIAALLSLRCTHHKDLQGMWLAMNADECGAFDDVVLHLQTTNGKKITYLIQLKHKVNPTDVSTREFKSKKGDFLLAKYHDTIVQIHQAIADQKTNESEIIAHLRHNRDSLVFILFTNRGTTTSDFLKDVPKTSSTELEWLLYQLIDTNGNVFLFDYDKLDFSYGEDVGGFMGRLFLFTKQIHISKLDGAIEAAVENLARPLKLTKTVLNEVVQKFVQFVTDWSQGELGGFYPLTKEHVFQVLLEHIVTPYVMKLDSLPDYGNGGHGLWGKIMEEKSFTIIHPVDGVVTTFLHRYVYGAVKEYCEDSTNKNQWKRHPDLVSRKIRRTTGRVKEIRFCDAYEFLWKNHQLPLLLTADDSENFSNLVLTLKVFPETFRACLLLKGVDNLADVSSNFFCNLNDLDRCLTMEVLNLPVMIQGRSSIKLADVVGSDLMPLISTKDIIHVLAGEFTIGKSGAALPDIFIQRSLEKVWLKPEVLQENIPDVFLVKYTFDRDLAVFLRRLNLDDSKILRWNNFDGSSNLVDFKIIAVQNDNFESIRKRLEGGVKPVHSVVLHEGFSLEWIDSSGPITNLMDFRKSGDLGCAAAKLAATGRTTLISACPGMGKSIVMDYLALHAPTSVWVLRINLFEHVDYYKSDQFEAHLKNPSRHADFFFSSSLKESNNDVASFTRTVFNQYLDSGKILLLLDGFDEVPISCQQQVSRMIKSLHDSSYWICVTTRPILRIHLEELLGTFAVGINPFTKADQESFLIQYFAEDCGGADAPYELIREFVDNLLASSQKNLSYQDEEFTGVPLQTNLLAGVFLKDCKKFIESKHFENVHFDLLYLYKHFIEEKLRIICSRLGSSSDDMFHHFKEYRALYALRTLFNKDDLKPLNLEDRLKQLVLFFPDTLQQLQKDGIVVIEDEANVTFVHRTFAEYLAAEWLAQNATGEHRATVQTLLKRTFESNFNTVRNIFDRILSKDHPLHLAVINRHVDRFKELIVSNQEVCNETDKFNRTCLHMIAAWGAHHPYSPQTTEELKNLHQLVIKDPMMRIIKAIPGGKLRTTRDKLLDCTELDYAILSGSLNVADAISARLENVNDSISLLDIHINYSWHFKNFPYGSLGSILLKHSVETELATYLEARKLQLQDPNEQEELHHAVVTDNLPKASLLLTKGEAINKPDATGFVPLHTATMFGLTMMVQLLLANGAEVNIRDFSGKNSLHWAAATGQSNITSLFLSNTNVDPNTTDNNGMSPLHYAVVANRHHQHEIVLLLLDHGAPITTKDNYGKTPLHYALHYNQPEILHLLLKVGAEITTTNNQTIFSDHDVLTSRDSDGGTVLHWAADMGRVDLVELFLSYRAQVDIQDDDGKRALHWAAEQGHGDVVTLLLNHGDDANAKDASGRTPLFFAADNAHMDVVKLLLDAGASVDDKDDLGRTPLLQASLKNNHDVVDQLLSVTTSNAEAKDNEAMTPLLWAAWGGHLDVAKLLLGKSKGGQLEGRNLEGKTALMGAALYGHASMVKFLLINGADVQAKDDQSVTALHLAAWNGHLPTVGLLVSHEANLDAPDANGSNPLMWAARNGHVNVSNLLITSSTLAAADTNNRTALVLAAHNGHSLMLAMLISKGADVEAADVEGMNALHHATHNGHASTVDLLLASNPTLINSISKYAKTALIYAADLGRTTLASLLLANGADVNARDNENMSALTWAAHNNHFELVDLLLKHAPDLETKNRHGRTPLLCAAQNGHVDVVILLLSKGADLTGKDNEGMSAVSWAVYYGYADMVKVLLERGSGLETADEDGRTLLIQSAYNGHAEVADLLLSKGSLIDHQDDDGMTTLHWACWKGHASLVDLLLTKGANVEIGDNYGKTPIFQAVMGGQLSVVALLLAKGADVNVQDRQGRTALHVAALVGLRDVAEVLVRTGANLEIQDQDGKTPLVHASSRDYVAIAAFLLANGANVQARDGRDLTALDWANFNGCQATAAYLVNWKKEINQSDGDYQDT